MSDQWPSATLAEIATDVRNGIATKPEGDSGTPILRISAVRPMELRLDDLRYVASAPSEYELRENDLLFTRYSGTPEFVGACARVPHLTSPLVYPDKLIRVRVDPAKADAGFVEAAFASPEGRSQVRAALKTSAGQVGISGSSLKEILIPLPALDEQRRIVAKLDALRARSRRAKEALDAVPALLDKLRQSILAAAFRGDLTADWREAHPHVEPASELLKRIRVERRKRWEEADLAKMTAKGKPPKDDRWKAKYVEPEPVDESDLPELPDGWCWASLSEVSLLQLGQRRAPEYKGMTEYPYLRAANITWDGLDLRDVRTMGFEEPEYLRLEPGDVVLNEASGSPLEVGKPALWNGEISHCCFQATVLRVRPASRLVLGAWLQTCFLADALLGRFAAMAPGVGILHLTAERMRSWPVPLAPVSEQERVVDVVRAALASANGTRDASRDLANRVAALDAASLGSAFAGRLFDGEAT